MVFERNNGDYTYDERQIIKESLASSAVAGAGSWCLYCYTYCRSSYEYLVSKKGVTGINLYL